MSTLNLTSVIEAEYKKVGPGLQIFYKIFKWCAWHQNAIKEATLENNALVLPHFTWHH